ncbi:CxxH/CxxC protein [Siminovitchia sediminis]|uniref:CxxH/CxxC protein n=1 Tax=Siminovitchia sediminis TaxID=1274353 RepID=A0ABW4KCZ9_9BACI
MIYCCQEHVELALDRAVDEYETAPILKKIDTKKDKDKLPTPCEFCKNAAEYIVGN